MNNARDNAAAKQKVTTHEIVARNSNSRVLLSIIVQSYLDIGPVGLFPPTYLASM